MIGVNSFLYPVIFANLITSVPVTQACQSDLGVTIATGVSQWNDITSNAKHYTQGTTSKQPAYGTTKLNGYSVLTFDGTDDELTSSLILPVAGTTPTYTGFVGRQNVYASSGTFLGDTSTGTSYPKVLNSSAPTPRLQAFNGTSVLNTGATIGSWFFFECYWSNSTADFLKIGATNSTGVNAGNLYTSTGRMLGFSGGTGSVHGNIEIAMVLHTAGLPSAAERAALAKGITQKYGGTVGV